MYKKEKQFIKYRELTTYKYELAEPYSIQTEIRPNEIIQYPAENPYITLYPNGMLCISKGYAWDGASGIAVDTSDFMRPSVIHDSGYQFMRKGLIPISFREYFDTLLRDTALEDGMSWIRAHAVYLAVRTFGEKYATPTDEAEQQDIILEAPKNE